MRPDGQEPEPVRPSLAANVHPGLTKSRKSMPHDGMSGTARGLGVSPVFSDTAVAAGVTEVSGRPEKPVISSERSESRNLAVVVVVVTSAQRDFSTRPLWRPRSK